MQLDSVRDIKLAGRAVNSDWDVPSEVKRSVVNRLSELSKCGDPELEIAASKVLLAADALVAKKRDQERRRVESEHARKLQLVELAVKLGIAGHDGSGAGVVDSVKRISGNG